MSASRRDSQLLTFYYVDSADKVHTATGYASPLDQEPLVTVNQDWTFLGSVRDGFIVNASKGGKIFLASLLKLGGSGSEPISANIIKQAAMKVNNALNNLTDMIGPKLLSGALAAVGVPMAIAMPIANALSTMSRELSSAGRIMAAKALVGLYNMLKAAATKHFKGKNVTVPPSIVNDIPAEITTPTDELPTTSQPPVPPKTPKPEPAKTETPQIPPGTQSSIGGTIRKPTFY